jgi:hypothetical protein
VVEQLVKKSTAERSNELQRIRFTQTDKITDVEKRVLDISSDLWLFLQEANEAIFGIVDWGVYRRATASTVKLGSQERREWLERVIATAGSAIPALSSFLTGDQVDSPINTITADIREKRIREFMERISQQKKTD